MATVITFEHVYKRFTTHTRSIKDLVLGVAGHRPSRVTHEAVRDLSFTIERGESVALLGHNGSGKSTTLKMLGSILQPSSGLIRARGRIAPLLELGAGFHADLTGGENIYLNGALLKIPRAEIKRRFDEIVDFAELEDYIDTPLKFYSSGMAMRLGFSIAVNIDPDILLVDEVLAVGDHAFQEKSLARMKSFRDDRRTIIFVTHSINSAAEFCDRALVLDHGELVHDGSVAEGRERYFEHPRETS